MHVQIINFHLDEVSEADYRALTTPQVSGIVAQR